MTVSKDTEAMINARIAEIDELSRRSSTRSCTTRVPEAGSLLARAALPGARRPRPATTLKIRVLNVTKKELLKDLEKAAEFDQSALFKKVYEEEFGTFGGAPFGVLVGDYEFGRHPAGHRPAREDLATSPPRPTRRSSRRPARSCSTWTSFTELATRATWPRSSRPSSTSSGGRSANRRTRATSAWRCRTS